MLIFDIIMMSLKSLRDNGLRSVLSMLGIIIGVAAVVAVVSVGSGAEKQIMDQINQLGTNMITITPSQPRGSSGRVSQELTDVFTYEMTQQILTYCPDVDKASPFIDNMVLAVRGSLNVRSRSRATTASSFDMLNLEIGMGRTFSDEDIEESRLVAIIGSDVAKDLFEYEDPIGQDIKLAIGNHRVNVTVIGVLEEKGELFFNNFDTYVFLPITTWMNRIQTTRYVNGFLAQAATNQDVAPAVAQLENLFFQRLKNKDRFRVSSQEEMLNMATTFAKTFTILLGGIASIALLVGGIGIMNITLVSVTERTREIGIRKALGAKKRVILLQFLIESCTISLFGGIIGLGFGTLGAFLLAQIGGWPFIVTMTSAIIALVFSTLIGLFFGLYPANKAARLDPVNALNYE